MPVRHPDVGDVGPGHVVARHPVPLVVRAQPILLYLQISIVEFEEAADYV